MWLRILQVLLWLHATGILVSSALARPQRACWQISAATTAFCCTIHIWTLDGDLVRKLAHRGLPGTAAASMHAWNVITRNGQKVQTGLYIWAVESRYGTDVGKLAVIR